MKFGFTLRLRKRKKQKQWTHMMVLMVMMFVNALSYGILIPLIYPLASRFGLSATGLGILLASYAISQFIATPIIGRLSDKFGRKPLLLICLLGTSLSLIFFALSTQVWMLFIARILDGITGGNNSVAQASVADVSKGSERAQLFGILGASYGMGFLFGPALGGLLTQFGSTAPLWFASSLAFSGVVLGLIFMKETLTTKKKIQREQLFSFSKIWKGLTTPPTGRFFILILLSATAQGAFIVGVQTFSYDVLKMTEKMFGVLLGVAGMVNIIMQAGFLKLLIKKFGSKISLLQISFIGSAFTMFVLFFVNTVQSFTAVILLYMIFFSLQNPLLSSIISEKSKSEDQGGALGLNQSYASLGMIFGPLLMSLAVSSSLHLVFVISGMILFVGAFVTFVTQKKTKKQFDF